jgi:hypothetical protein
MAKITAVGLLTREQFSMVYGEDISEVRWVLPVSLPTKKPKKYAILALDWWRPKALKWGQYRKLVPGEDRPQLTAVKDYVIQQQIHCCAFAEQVDNYFLVLSDGAIFCFDYVAWETFLAVVWNTVGNCRYYTYLDFMPYDKYDDLTNAFVRPEVIKAERKALWKKGKGVVKKVPFDKEANKSRIHWKLMFNVRDKQRRKLAFS